MRVRPARPSDMPRVSELAAALVRQHHALDAERFLLVASSRERRPPVDVAPESESPWTARR